MPADELVEAVLRVVLPTEAVLRVPDERVELTDVFDVERVAVERVAVPTDAVERPVLPVEAVERVAVAVERVAVAVERPEEAVERGAVRVAPADPAVLRPALLAVRVAVLRVLAVFALPNVRLRVSDTPRVTPP